MDTLNITILDDGTIKIEADKISQANHVTAEGFIRECVNLSGGKAERKFRQGMAHHHHHADESHEHHH